MYSADFQPRDASTSRWLRQEIKKAGLCVPFITATFGFRSKSSTLAVLPLLGLTTVAVAGAESIPAAGQAAGLEIPALVRAAAIFCCCVIWSAVGGLELSALSRIISGDVPPP